MSLTKEERNSLENELVEKLGREGYCSVACRVIQEFRQDASPWIITNPNNEARDIHFFLFDGRFAIDMWGIYPLPELLKVIDNTAEGLIAKSTEWKRVWQHERELGMCAEEKEIVERRFRQHILHSPKTYGVIETKK